MVTKYGVIKRTLLSEYEYQRKGGKIALNLDEGDELVFVMHTDGNSDLILATHEGAAARFTESAIRPLSRTARGVRGVRLRGEDYVVGAVRVDDEKQLVTVTEGGYGKRTPFDDFRVKGRGNKAHPTRLLPFHKHISNNIGESLCKIRYSLSRYSASATEEC